MKSTERPSDVELVRRACDTLLKIPGVFSVGIGSKLVNGVSTGERAFSILVLEKKPTASLAPHEIIPAEIEGLPTDVLESGPPQLIADVEEQEDFDSGIVRDTDEYRPILGGIQIRGARSIVSNGAHTFGTLGGFALTTGKNPGQRVLLTNHHVLDDQDGNLHGPSCTGCTKGDGVGNPNSGSQIATILRGNDGDEVDAAIAILNEGVQFQRDVIKDDAPAPHREAVGESRALNDSDRDSIVHKRGMRSRLTYGVVGSPSATTPAVAGGKQRHNQIRIDLERKVQESGTVITFETADRIFVPSVDFIAKNVQVNDVVFIQAPAVGRFRITQVVDANRLELAANSSLTPGTSTHTLFVTPPLFALKGDSGSLLLDANGRPVGLVWAAFTESVFGNAWASRIERVEDLLHIKIDAAVTVGDTQVARVATRPGTDGESLRAAPIAAGDVAPPGTLRALVEEDLMEAPRGRQIHQLYFAHQTEVRDLIDGNREVALVWHRQGGPGMLQAILDAARSRTTEIPAAIRGRSWGERVHAILDAFARSGSSRLREDIVRFGRELEMLGGMSYPRFLQSLKA
jgi:hypothetical protein